MALTPNSSVTFRNQMPVLIIISFWNLLTSESTSGGNMQHAILNKFHILNNLSRKSKTLVGTISLGSPSLSNVSSLRTMLIRIISTSLARGSLPYTAMPIKATKEIKLRIKVTRETLVSRCPLLQQGFRLRHHQQETR